MPIVVISGHGDINTAVEATKLGAFDFIEKPLERERVLVTVRNAVDTRRLQDREQELSRATPRRNTRSSATRRRWRRSAARFKRRRRPTPPC